MAVGVILRPSLLIRHLIAPLSPQVVFCGSGRRAELAITIDDGPWRSPEPDRPDSLSLLALIEALQIPVCFFVIGDHLRQAGEQFVPDALAAGHSFGNHLGHDGIAALLSRRRLLSELQQTEQECLRRALPQRLRLRWFRPGGGWFHGPMLQWIASRGYRLVLGSLWPWDTFHPGVAFQCWFVLANAHPGAILVLHDRPDTTAATIATLQRVVPELRRRGYRFVSLEQLLA